MNHYAVTVLVAGLLVPAAPAPKEVDDAKALQGVWRVASVEEDGKAAPADDVKNITVTFEKDTFTMKEGDKVTLRGTFKLDPAAKPKGIDMTITEAGKGEHTPKKMLGVYEWSKDGLRWCVAMPDAKERPKALETKEGDGQTLLTLKREKAQAAMPRTE
jgi:uncharacterized protein (TIGR03067 family)